jgi:hypothetical protein
MSFRDDKIKIQNCGCALTSSTKKGHDYYYCTNRKEKCEEHKSYMRETYLYGIFANVLGNLAFSERKIELMYKSAKEKIGIDSEYFDNALATLQNSLESLTTRESKLLDTFLADQISKEIYDKKMLEIHNDRISINKQIQELKNKQPASMLEPTKNAFIQGNRAMKEFLDADNFKKRNIVENLCWNLSFKDKNVAQIKLKTPFDVMYKAPKNGTLSQMLCSPVSE